MKMKNIAGLLTFSNRKDAEAGRDILESIGIDVEFNNDVVDVDSGAVFGIGRFRVADDAEMFAKWQQSREVLAGIAHSFDELTDEERQRGWRD